MKATKVTRVQRESPLKEKCVVFLDILGFKELVTNAATDPEAAHRINWTLNKIRGLGYRAHTESYESTVFSDSVVISVDLGNDEITQLMIKLAHITMSIMRYGIFMRGGIAIGLLSNQRGNPWGPGFIKAYETETRLAVYPRVVLSKDTFKWMEDNCDISQLLIKRDKYDGVYFIDAIKGGMTHYGKDEHLFVGMLEQISKHLNGGLASVIDNPSVYEKYKWLCGEWDRSLAQHQEHYSDVDFEPYFTSIREHAGDFRALKKA